MTEADSIPAIVLPGHWDFEYDYFAGEAASRFFYELKRQRIVGTVCPNCHRVLVPARSFCDACFVATDEFREVGTTGRVEAFTIMTRGSELLPPPPLVIGYVVLEGASTALLNVIAGVDLDDFDQAGSLLMQRPSVEVVFHDDPAGRISDFHFTLSPSS